MKTLRYLNIMINAISKQFDSKVFSIKNSVHLHLAFADAVNLHFHPPRNAIIRDERPNRHDELGKQAELERYLHGVYDDVSNYDDLKLVF